MSTESITPSPDHVSERGNSSLTPHGSHASLARGQKDTFGEKSSAQQDAGGRIVGWDGPRDAANPLHWSRRRKWLNIGVISMISTVT